MLVTPSAAGTVVEGALCVRLKNSYLCGIVCSINKNLLMKNRVLFFRENSIFRKPLFEL